jgi:hypothetical protein
MQQARIVHVDLRRLHLPLAGILVSLLHLPHDEGAVTLASTPD